MIICESLTFQLGPYTVHQRPRTDSPGWAVYLVYLGHRFIGKSFSIPDEGCCQWLERSGGRYAEPSQKPRRQSAKNSRLFKRSIFATGRNGHPRT